MDLEQVEESRTKTELNRTKHRCKRYMINNNDNKCNAAVKIAQRDVSQRGDVTTRTGSKS